MVDVLAARQKALRLGQERAHDFASYVVKVTDTNGNLVIEADNWARGHAGGKLGTAYLNKGETESSIVDNKGNLLYHETKEETTGLAPGLRSKYRWARSVIPDPHIKNPVAPIAANIKEKYKILNYLIPGFLADPDILPHKDYVSTNEQERMNQSPTSNVLKTHAVGRAYAVPTTSVTDHENGGQTRGDKGVTRGFDGIKSEKVRWYGPNKTKLYNMDECYGGQTLLDYARRGKYVEITDNEFLQLIPAEYILDGSGWLSRHKIVKGALKKLSWLTLKHLPVSANTGMEVYLVDGDERLPLAAAKRDFLNTDQVIFSKPTEWVEVLGKYKYKVGVKSKFWGAIDLNPEYWKRAIDDHWAQGWPYRYPGKDYGFGSLSPYANEIYITGVNDDGTIGDPVAAIDIDADRTYGDIVFEFNLCRPKEYIMNFDKIPDRNESNKIWDYLYEKREWLQYLRGQRGLTEDQLTKEKNMREKARMKQEKKSEGIFGKFSHLWKGKGKEKPSETEIYQEPPEAEKLEPEESESLKCFTPYELFEEWYKDVEFVQKGDQKIELYRNETQPSGKTKKAYIGRFEVKGDNLYYKDNTNLVMHVGSAKKNGDGFEISTDGKEQVGDIIMQRDLRNKTFNHYVSLRDKHKGDGVMLMKGIVTMTLSLQDSLRMGRGKLSRRQYKEQTRLEPALDLLASLVYTGKKDAYGKYDLERYNWTSEMVSQDVTPDFAFIAQKIDPRRIKDEDIRRYMEWADAIVEEKEPEEIPATGPVQKTLEEFHEVPA